MWPLCGEAWSAIGPRSPSWTPPPVAERTVTVMRLSHLASHCCNVLRITLCAELDLQKIQIDTVF